FRSALSAQRVGNSIGSAPALARMQPAGYKRGMSSATIADLGVGPAQRELLTRHGFDLRTFASLRKELRAGKFTPERNRVVESIAPPRKGDLVDWPESDDREARACEAAGQAAILRGEVAVAILNGGMATRFGGRVKGVVEVMDGKGFLGLRLEDVGRASKTMPVFLMNSFATLDATAAHLAEHDHFGLAPARVHLLTQRISIRLTPTGELFHDHHGDVSLYAPGHGDLFEVLATSAAFRTFVDGGGKLVMIGNVDNLGATVSPKVVGAHLRGGKPVTVEVAPRVAGDKGGAPVRRADRLEVLEGFRFPPDFDIDTVPVFNTNTFVMDVAAMRADYALTWFRADKEVDGLPAVQFERLMGEVTAFVDSTYLRVPREGRENRFMPVKTPADLDTLRPALRARLA
ncbi:MAG: UTP--glucose-1-phosphate uridylyltransferase, partial [Myxococcota bacterium]